MSRTLEEKRIECDFELVWKRLREWQGTPKAAAEYAYRAGRVAGKSDGIRLVVQATKTEKELNPKETE